MAELDLIMQPYIDSGNYTEEELEKMRKLEYNKLQENTRETSWWKGEEGWIPDEFQPGVNRPRVKKEEPTVVSEFLNITNDQTEIKKREEHSIATSSLQPGDKEIPYRIEEDGNYRQDGTVIRRDDVYDPERKEASSVLDYIKTEYDTPEERQQLVLPFGLSFAALMKVKNPWIRGAGALGFALGFDQVVPDSDEEEDAVEETDKYKDHIALDFFNDMSDNLEQGWTRSESVEIIQNIIDKGDNITSEDLQELIEHDLKLAALGQTDEQRSYQKIYDNNKEKHGGVMAWMIAMKENPSFLAQTSANSIANMVGTYINSPTARNRANLGGATTYATNQGVSKYWKKNPIGKFASFMSGVYGANSATMEQSYTFVELMKEQLNADGKEFTPENLKSLLLDKEITTFKDPRFSTLDVTGTRREVMETRALRRGVAIGFVDMVSGLAVGAKIGPGKSYRALSAPGIAIPITGGLASEIAGQTAGGQEYDAGEILTEGFAEKGGPMVMLNTTREVIDRIKNPSVYEINGEKFSRSEFRKETSKMSSQDLNMAKIKVENDKGVSDVINEKRRRASIDNEIDPTITDVKDREKLIDLEIERTTLDNNEKKKKGIFKLVGNKEKLARTEEKINSILSKYEGVTKEDIKSQVSAGIAQSAADISFEGNMAFARKHSKLYGLDYKELSAQEIAGLNLPEGALTSAGFVTEINGVDTLVVNIDEKGKQRYGDSVGNHELLHGILKQAGITKKLKKSHINNFLKLIGSKNAALIQARIDKNPDIYTPEYMAQNLDEYLTMWSDILYNKEEVYDKEGIGLDKSVLTKIKNWIKDFFHDLGFTNIDFETAEGALEFLRQYNRSVHKGALGKSFMKATKAGKGRTTDTKTTGAVFSKSQDLTPEQRKQAINKLGKEYYDKDLEENVSFEVEHGNVFWDLNSNNIVNEMREKGLLDGPILEKYKNYKDNLDKAEITKEMFLNGVYAEFIPHIRNYKPEMQLEYAEEDRTGLNGWIMPQMGNKSLQAYEVLTRGKIQAPTVEIGQTTKEGEIKIQLEAEPDTYMEALETEDMSPQAVAKREAQKNKKKEARKSKLRQDLGIEDNSDLYNKVKDSARQSLILAYHKTRDIKDKDARVTEIVKLLHYEYAGEKGITSGKYTELFKLIKDSLGNKAEYIKNLKKNRESIVESIFTSDFVQVERKVPENEKTFIQFQELLTSKEQVEKAVNEGKLPKDSLKAIDKGQAVNLYKKVMPNQDEFVGFFDQPLITSEGMRSGLKGTRKDGLGKHISKAVIFDALLEVRQDMIEQEQKVLEKELKDLSEKEKFAETKEKQEIVKEKQKLIQEFKDSIDIIELSSKIGREVGVKFSKSSAVADIDNAIDVNTNTDVYSEIRFSKSHRDQYEKQLNKRRPDLTEEQRKNAVQSVFDFVDGRDIPNHKKSKYEKLAMHYMVNGYLILPEDGYKVIEAERIATIKKLDAFSYKNPNVLIEENVVRKKVKRTDPDKVKTFSNKKEYSDGVVVYDVEDSKQGQRDVREVIDTHFGENANPWCLCARQKEQIMDIPDMEVFDNREEAEAMKMVFEETGRYETVNVIPIDWNQPDGSVIPQWIVEANEPVKKLDPNYDELGPAWTHWKSYNQNTEGLGFRIAFHNGELVGFRDGKESPRWWDRMDKSTDAPVVRGKKGKDGYKTVSLAYKNKTVPQYLEKVTGDNKNGTTIKKDLDGTVTDITSKKDGKKHGKQFQRRDDKSSFYTSTINEVYNDGTRESFKEERFYKEHKGKTRVERIPFGRDEINIDNITKYERTFSNDTDGKILDETTVIEGTINQKYFKEFNDPSLAEGYTKTNLKYLIPAHERYYSIQGEKVKVVQATEGEVNWEALKAGYIDATLTINGEVQDVNVRFSKSQENEIKLSLNNIEEDNAHHINSILDDIGSGVIDIDDVIEKDNNVYKLKIPIERVFGRGPKQKSKRDLDFIAEVIWKVTNDATYDYIAKPILRATNVETLIKQARETGKISSQGIIFENRFRDRAFKFLKQIGSEVQSFVESKEVGKAKGDVYFSLGNVIAGLEIKLNKARGVSQTINFKRVNGRIELDFSNKNETQNYDNEIAEEIKAKFAEIEELIGEINEDFILDLNQIQKLKENKKDYVVTINMDNEKYITWAYAHGKYANVPQGMIALGEQVYLMETGNENVDKLHRDIADEYNRLNPNDKINTLKLNDEAKGIDLKAYVQINKNGKLTFRVAPIIQDTNFNESSNVLSDKNAKNFATAIDNTLKLSVSEKANTNLETVVKFSKSSKKPTKGITILDFDDTLATTKSLIKFTRPDGTKGTLTPEQYANTYQDLLGLDYEFDFSEFNEVIDGKPAPLLNKAKKLAEKFGTKNMFILTARPQQSAPAIRKFLKENGLNIPLKNIKGLGNSTADAKALWVLEKAAEGYNDFYFADDAIQNVKAVQNMLDQIDVKSKVQQARVKFSKSQDKYFNAILEDVSGVPGFKKFTQKVGEAVGFGKGKFRWFIPPSHEDFVGLLYNFIGKGKKGNNHRNFFDKTLIRPLNRAYRRLNEHKQVISNNYKKLVDHMPDVQSRLGEMIPNTDFTYEQAVRIYLWNKAGHRIPGLSKNQETTLVNIVKSYSDLQKFADMLGRISLVKEGYTTPGENWLAGSIKFDLVDATGRVGRAKIFSEFIENASVIFSPENLNKIESIYGKDFREALEDVLHRTITGNNRKSGSNKMVNAWMDWVNGSVGAVMFFNMRSAILQQLSFVNFMNFGDNNIFKASARFADQPQFWSDWAMIFNSNYLKQRRAGAAFDVNANEIAREVSRSKNPVRAVIRKLLDIGFTPTQIGDSFAIAMGGAGFYRNRVNTYIKQGLSKKESESKAFLDFQEIAEETQQSARPDMISQQQASPLGRFILAFQNVTSQYARIVKKSYLDLIKRRISKGYTTQAQSDQANISRIIYYGAIQSMIFYGLQTALFAMMFGDDDDEKFLTKKERVINGTIDSLLRGTGVYGAVVATIKNYAFKLHANLGPDSDEYFKSEAWPDLLQISPPIGIKVRQWRSMERTLDWNKDAIKEMETFDIDNPLWDATSKGVEAFTNVPVNRLYKKIQNIRAGLDSENAYWQRIAVTLGWSKWDVGIEESSKIGEAKVIGKKNRKKNKDRSGEEANKKSQERERESGETVLCAAISRKGDRCKNKVLKGKSYCTIHVNVEQNKTGEERQCKGQRSSGGRCKMKTNSKSGYCYYHD